MRLTRTAFQQIMALEKVNFDELPEHTREATLAKLQYLLEQFPHITEIEGVKNLSGAKHLVQLRVVNALEALGETVDDLTRDQLLLSSFLEGESLVG